MKTISPTLALAVEIRKGRRKLERMRELLRELPRPLVVFHEGATVNAKNVKSVVHYQTPASLEQYLGEIGIATERAVLLFDPADLVIHQRRAARTGGGFDERLRRQAVEAYARARGCRVQWLRRQFGNPEGSPCGICDNCLVASELVHADHPDHR